MKNISFNHLLLKTAFSCMACDGDIDIREVELIKALHNRKRLFGDIDINAELDNLTTEINKDGSAFLKQYFSELTLKELSEQDELKIIEAAIETIVADEKVEYSEIKFFKVIRSNLKISNNAILDVHPEFEEYLEEDIISESYLSQLQDDYLANHKMPVFQIISSLNDNLTDLIN